MCCLFSFLLSQLMVIFAPFLHKCIFSDTLEVAGCSRRTGVDTADLSYSKWNIWSCLFLEADPTLCFKFIFIYQRKYVSGDPVCSLGLFFITLLKRKEPVFVFSAPFSMQWCVSFLIGWYFNTYIWLLSDYTPFTHSAGYMSHQQHPIQNF